MTDKIDYCIGCAEPLQSIDEDPNGDMPSTCKRCRAEEDHDFDVDPFALFGRCGSRDDINEYDIEFWEKQFGKEIEINGPKDAFGMGRKLCRELKRVRALARKYLKMIDNPEAGKDEQLSTIIGMLKIVSSRLERMDKSDKERKSRAIREVQKEVSEMVRQRLDRLF